MSGKGPCTLVRYMPHQRPLHAQVICRLPPLLSIHRLSVTPVVGVVPAACIPSLRAAEAEVAAIFDAPLALFLGAAGHTQRDQPWVHGPAPGVRFRLHFFDYGQLGPIWCGLCRAQSFMVQQSVVWSQAGFSMFVLM